MHSVVNTKLSKNEIEGMREELLKFLLDTTRRCIPGVTTNFTMGCLVRDDSKDAAEYFKRTIQERPLHKGGKVDFNAALEIGAVCLCATLSSSDTTFVPRHFFSCRIAYRMDLSVNFGITSLGLPYNLM